MGWALIRGWALINVFCLWHGRLFEAGANSRLGDYSNKYGIKLKPLKTLELQYSSLPAKKTLLKSAGSFLTRVG